MATARKTAKTPTTPTAAVITIFNVGGMTKRGRMQIAAWMKKQADHLVADGEDYTRGRFTARYYGRYR